nr:MAG TPA: hypothetical protein [Bacteriophage sp.]
MEMGVLIENFPMHFLTLFMHVLFTHFLPLIRVK